MISIEYIMSAIGMTGIKSQKFTNSEHFDPFVIDALNECVSVVRDGIKNTSQTKNKFSLLFNAYTESDMPEFIDKCKKLSMDNVYADSGGLQIVTAGKSIDNDMKTSIYKTQSYSDYAMCFDVIPLETDSAGPRNVNERTNTGNKIFDFSRHAESGRLTGINIKNQIEKFDELGVNTKVLMIIQGNTPDDQMLYYDNIMQQLEDSHLSRIAGIAVADTCMGNKDLESIDMLIGAHRISKNCPDPVKNQIHLLGVGSVTRMAPLVYLYKSGFVSDYKNVSYDSSSHTLCYNYGCMKLDGACYKMGTHRNKINEKYWKDIYDTFYNVLKKYNIEYEWMLNKVVFAEDNTWAFSGVGDRAVQSNDKKHMICASILNWIYSLYQMQNFIQCIDKLADDKFDLNRSTLTINALESLKKVKDLYDMAEWKKMFEPYIHTGRIRRKNEQPSLLELFS